MAFSKRNAATELVFKGRTEVCPGWFGLNDWFLVADHVSKCSERGVWQKLFEVEPETGIRALGQRALKPCDDLQSCVVIASAQWYSNAGTLNDSVGPEHSPAFATCQHKRFVWRASSCNAVKAATTFFPRLPFGAKSRPSLHGLVNGFTPFLSSIATVLRGPE